MSVNITNISTTPEPDPCAIEEKTDTASSSSALRSVAVLYGVLFLSTLLIYCLIRNVKRFQTLYNVRNSVKELNCDLAKDHLGTFDWIWRVLYVSEDELFEQGGFVSVTYTRLLWLGTKLALMGCFIAVWLCPTYRYSPTRGSNEHVTDALDMLTTGRTHTADPRLWGTIIGLYLLNGFAMYLLYHEFNWYVTRRHEYLSRETAQNHTVYIGGVPKQLRSARALGEFLRVMFQDDVCAIHFARNIDKLEKDCAEHEAISARLQHEEALLTSTGKRPRRLSLEHGDVDAIDSSNKCLEKLSAKIRQQAAELEKEWVEHERRVGSGDQDAVENPPESTRDAAFVCFRTLRTATTALQVLHHQTPFQLLAEAAPSPKDVTWGNVGLNHWRVQVTSIFAGLLTGITIILWTFPMSFIAFLSKVGELKKLLPFLETASDAMTFDLPSGQWRLMDEILAAVQPVALLTFNSFLPTILGFYSRLEGHIGAATLQASIFSKLTLFNIVQTFFVSAIAGSLFDQINCLVDDPTNQTITILATSLPSQAVTFMGLIIVSTTFGMTIELLRVFPALYGLIRRRVGPNLTEEERQQDYLFFAPLCNPGSIDYTSLTSDLILLFIILFVYAILAPITSFVVLLGFACLNVGYRNQIMFVYDPSNDTGGKLWPRAAGYIVLCMLIAQVTIFGVLSLKQSPLASGVIPLFVVTVLFWRYLQQQHLRVADTLPIMVCNQVDAERHAARGDDFGFLSGTYIQEALLYEAEPDPEAALASCGGSGGGGSEVASATLGYNSRSNSTSLRADSARSGGAGRGVAYRKRSSVGGAGPLPGAPAAVFQQKRASAGAILVAPWQDPTGAGAAPLAVQEEGDEEGRTPLTTPEKAAEQAHGVSEEGQVEMSEMPAAALSGRAAEGGGGGDAGLNEAEGLPDTSGATRRGRRQLDVGSSEAVQDMPATSGADGMKWA